MHLIIEIYYLYWLCIVITDRVRSTTGRLWFNTCLSVCPHLGGYPPMGGPCLGYPCQTWLGVPWGEGTLTWVPPIMPGWGYPTSGMPMSDLAVGVPRWGVGGGTLPWVHPPPIRPGWGGGTQQGGTRGGGTPTSGTSPIEPGWWRVPHLG